MPETTNYNQEEPMRRNLRVAGLLVTEGSAEAVTAPVVMVISGDQPIQQAWAEPSQLSSNTDTSNQDRYSCQ